MAPRARAALRQGYQNSSLAADSANEQDAQNDIRFWKLAATDAPFQYDEHNAPTIISEIEIDKYENKTISFINTELSEQDNLELSQQKAIAAVEGDGRILNDFRLHLSNNIVEMDYDGENQQTVAVLHTFARYIGNIPVSTNPRYGEYLNIILNGGENAEMDLLTYSSVQIDTGNTDSQTVISMDKVLSKDMAIAEGLDAIKYIQETQRGIYYYEPEFRLAQLMYVVSPKLPGKLVLAWEVIDKGQAFVIIDAQDGSTLYWSE